MWLDDEQPNTGTRTNKQTFGIAFFRVQHDQSLAAVAPLYNGDIFHHHVFADARIELYIYVYHDEHVRHIRILRKAHQKLKAFN